jgi:hypothetical protein
MRNKLAKDKQSSLLFNKNVLPYNTPQCYKTIFFVTLVAASFLMLIQNFQAGESLIE